MDVMLCPQYNDDALVEVLKHLDAKSLAMAACVNRQWKRAAELDRLWESICTEHWPLTLSLSPPSSQKMRAVVLALGGYRRLYLICMKIHLPPILHEPSNLYCTQWSKEAVQLSLSLFSIDCYERMTMTSDASSLMFLEEKRGKDDQPKQLDH